ncbi:MAG: ABC transporter permease, partial [Pseudomonadota bacterium]
MLREALKLTIRLVNRSRLHTILTLSSLALGFSVSLLAISFVWGELTYDQQWPSSDRLYRVKTTIERPGRAPQSYPQTFGPLALERERLEGVEFAARAIGQWDTISTGPDFEINHVVWGVDPAILDLMPLDFIAGNRASALNNPSSIIISASMAERLFGR